MKTLPLLFSILLFSACTPTDPNQQIDEGQVQGSMYESKEIGWQIEIPKDWKIIAKDAIEANDEKGKEAIKEAIGQEVDAKSLKHLISFQKDQFNIFNSTSQPYKEESPGDYQVSNKALNEIIYHTFANQGIKVDTSSGYEKIQDLQFNKFSITVYDNKNNVILKQLLFSRLINGYDFGVNINYNNEQDKETMLNAFYKSKFGMKTQNFWHIKLVIWRRKIAVRLYFISWKIIKYN